MPNPENVYILYYIQYYTILYYTILYYTIYIVCIKLKIIKIKKQHYFVFVVLY
jgi:hypothetical protein